MLKHVPNRIQQFPQTKPQGQKTNDQKRQGRSDRNKQLRQMFYFAIVTLATWLNPEATIAIAALKFCFMLLEYLRSHRQQ
jgi:hypothetical protein